MSVSGINSQVCVSVVVVVLSFLAVTSFSASGSVRGCLRVVPSRRCRVQCQCAMSLVHPCIQQCVRRFSQRLRRLLDRHRQWRMPTGRPNRAANSIRRRVASIMLSAFVPCPVHVSRCLLGLPLRPRPQKEISIEMSADTMLMICGDIGRATVPV